MTGPHLEDLREFRICASGTTFPDLDFLRESASYFAGNGDGAEAPFCCNLGVADAVLRHRPELLSHAGIGTVIRWMSRQPKLCLRFGTWHQTTFPEQIFGSAHSVK